MGKLINIKDIPTYIKKNTATFIGGYFDLFHVGHLRILKKCSELCKPLVVAIGSDKLAKTIKGNNRPIIKQRERAEIIAALSFVDFVIIINSPRYHKKYLNMLYPKFYVFSEENMEYRKHRKILIESDYPLTKVVFFPNQSSSISTSKIIEKIKTPNRKQKINVDEIIFKLNNLVEKSSADVGRVSALIKCNRKIVVQEHNTSYEHAEIIAINKAKKLGVDLEKSDIYIWVPPCLLCAKEILSNKIKKVFYIYEYGLGDGKRLLKKNGVAVERYAPPNKK